MRQNAFHPVHKVEPSALKVHKVYKVTGVLRTVFIGSKAAVG